MTFRDSLIHIFKEYPKAMAGPFRGHPLAYFIRHDFLKSLMTLCNLPDRYKWQGITQQGKWSLPIWFASLDNLITNTADSGYYPVYLFREDFSGFYLSLNQGVTGIMKEYGVEGKEVLKGRAVDLRTQIKGLTDNFREETIDLRPSTAYDLASFYEAGNICANYYDADSIPVNKELQSDFDKMLRLYSALSYSRTVIVGINYREEEEAPYASVEDLRNFRHHKRADLAQAARKANGQTCKVCGYNYGKVFGSSDHPNIEVHLLKPVSELKGEKLLLDPQKDFAAVCPNCHRVIHGDKHFHDIEAFKKKYFGKNH